MSLLPPSSQAAHTRSLEDLRRERLEKLLLQSKPQEPTHAARFRSPPGIQSQRR